MSPPSNASVDGRGGILEVQEVTAPPLGARSTRLRLMLEDVAKVTGSVVEGVEEGRRLAK